MEEIRLLRLFGEPTVFGPTNDGIRLRTRKQLGLLVILALEGRVRPIGRERLVGLLWPDVEAKLGRHSLAQALTALRLVLGRGALRRVGDGVQLADGLRTDLDLCASDPTALTVPLGSPLDGMEYWAGVDLAHWVEAARARCREQAAETLREALGQFRSAGQSGRAYVAATLLYELDPLSDVAAQALAEHALVQGDVTGAIKKLREHFSRVETAIGSRGNPDLRHTLERLEAGSYPPVEIVPAHLASDARRIPTPLFIGREGEVAHLEAIWEHARSGDLLTCCIVGPAGIGKSSLLRRFAAAIASRGYPVYHVTCQEIGRGIPFSAVSDLVGRLAQDPSIAATDPQWLSEASRIYPALRASYPGVPEPGVAPAESMRLRLAEALYRMVEATREGRPFMLLFDDIQHLDAASRDVLFVLLRRLEGHPVLILAGARCSRDGFESVHLEPLDDVEQLDWHERLSLEPLPDEASRALIHGLCGGSRQGHAVLAKIASLAEGNPHFIEMLVADWRRHAEASLAAVELASSVRIPRWQPPRTLRLAFARQYSGLSIDARHLLEVLATAGRSLTQEEASGWMEEPTHQSDMAVLELIERGIVRLDGNSLCFKNDLHRAYVYYAMPLETRKFHHARVGRGLLALGPTDFRAYLEAGHHFLRAGLNDDSVDLISRGARLAITAGAAKEAEQSLRSVLPRTNGTRQLEIALLLAECLCAEGAYAATLQVLDTIAVAPGDTAHQSVAAVVRAEASYRIGTTDERKVHKTVQNAVRLSARAGDEGLHLRAVQTAAEAASEGGSDEGLIEATEMAAAVAARGNPEARARALMTEAYCLMMRGKLTEARDRFVKSAALLDQEGLEVELARVLNGIGICQIGVGQHEEAVASFAAAATLVVRSGDVGQLANIMSNVGCAYEELGFFDAASTHYQHAVKLSTDSRTPRRIIEACVNSADLALIVGDVDGAAEMLTSAQNAAKSCHVWRLIIKVRLAQADLCLARDEPEAAWHFLEEVSTLEQDRLRPLDEPGRYERLRRHYCLATGDRVHANSILDQTDPSGCARIGDQLELGGFLEWAAGELGRQCAASNWSFLEGVSRHGLYGILARLAAVKVYPSGITVHTRAESGMKLVDRVFPERTRVLPPHLAFPTF